MTFPSPCCGNGLEGWSEKPNTQGQFDIQWLFGATRLIRTGCKSLHGCWLDKK